MPGLCKGDEVLGYCDLVWLEQEDDSGASEAEKPFFLPFFDPGVGDKVLDDAPAVGGAYFDIGNRRCVFCFNKGDSTTVCPKDPWKL